jgi:immunoglobulin-binding protein 1
MINEDAESSKCSTLTERFLRAIALVESAPETCLPLLESIHGDVQALGLFSTNEGMDDVGTKSIPFLAVDHFLGTALTNLPAAGPGATATRRGNVLRGMTHWALFLERLEGLEVLSKEETKEFHDLLDQQQRLLDGDGLTDGPPQQQLQLPSGPTREAKIERFRARQRRQKEIDRLRSLRERRDRCGMAPEDEMDGHDQESLDRSLALGELDELKQDALENWSSSLRELPMIDMMLKMEAEREHVSKHAGSTGNGSMDGTSGWDPRRPPPNSKGLQVTHITKNVATGQLQFKRDEVRSKVFRPSWNQPTMTLEELGEREYHQAMEREERQKQAEAERVHQPKRYEELVRDGMEDNAELVEASANLDREWDDWKDENPRGSGNKMANRGDRNF